jgi:hypothetical protein
MILFSQGLGQLIPYIPVYNVFSPMLFGPCFLFLFITHLKPLQWNRIPSRQFMEWHMANNFRNVKHPNIPINDHSSCHETGDLSNKYPRLEKGKQQNGLFHPQFLRPN